MIVILVCSHLCKKRIKAAEETHCPFHRSSKLSGKREDHSRAIKTEFQDLSTWFVWIWKGLFCSCFVEIPFWFLCMFLAKWLKASEHSLRGFLPWDLLGGCRSIGTNLPLFVATGIRSTRYLVPGNILWKITGLLIILQNETWISVSFFVISGC